MGFIDLAVTPQSSSEPCFCRLWDNGEGGIRPHETREGPPVFEFSPVFCVWLRVATGVCANNVPTALSHRCNPCLQNAIERAVIRSQGKQSEWVDE